VEWHDRSFQQLAVEELYEILALRQRVFILEQACLYADADGLDPASRHLWAASSAGIAAYLRIVPAGAKFPEVSIGRVIVAPAARGTGLGYELMRRGIAAVAGQPIRTAAQAHLEKFYAQLGFVRVSDNYDDDGIAHVDMLRS
jgi:ElaA protein